MFDLTEHDQWIEYHKIQKDQPVQTIEVRLLVEDANEGAGKSYTAIGKNLTTGERVRQRLVLPDYGYDDGWCESEWSIHDQPTAVDFLTITAKNPKTGKSISWPYCMHYPVFLSGKITHKYKYTTARN